MSKYDLAQGLYDGIPESLSALFESAVFGQFTPITVPATEEAANIAVGKFCAEMQNNIFVPLSGFPIVQALMYIGSLNPPVIASLFAGLESVEGGGAFDVIAPKNGGVYPGFFDGWVVRAPDVEQLSVVIGEGEDAESFELSQNDDIWSKNWPVPIGEHTATITDGSQSMTISFVVVEFSMLPPVVTNRTEEEKEVEVRLELSDEVNIKDAEVVITDSSTGISYSTILQGAAFVAGVAVAIVTVPVSTTAVAIAGTVALAVEGAVLVNSIVADIT